MPPHAAEEWSRQYDFLPSRAEKEVSYDDFKPLEVLGNGDMGKVILAVHRRTNVPYALKVMDKQEVQVRKTHHRAECEKEILSKVNHPFLPKLHAHFENDKYSFLMLDYCHGGDLNVLRQKQAEKKFSENVCRFYIAEVVLALEYLHRKKIVYRDLKPENILIQDGGHIMLTDFDLSLDISARDWVPKPARVLMSNQIETTPTKDRRTGSSTVPLKLLFSCTSPRELDKSIAKKKPPKSRVTPEEMYRKAGSQGKPPPAGPAHSFVGTEEYVAPEVVWGKGHGLAVDWWTLGVLLYELYYGKTPFKGVNRKETFYNILCRRVEISGAVSHLTDLIEKLLQKEPERRLGTYGGAEEIKRHPFFEGVRWENLHDMSRAPLRASPVNMEELEAGAEKRDPKEYLSSIKARISGPMRLTEEPGQADSQVKRSVIDLKVTKSGQYSLGGEQRGVRAMESLRRSRSNRKEEVRLSNDSAQKLFDLVF